VPAATIIRAGPASAPEAGGEPALFPISRNAHTGDLTLAGTVEVSGVEVLPLHVGQSVDHLEPVPDLAPTPVIERVEFYRVKATEQARK
jgi:hypothetical protein